ncbi:hypothetical protein BG011_002094 [Mortierella polycephala]|uniref:Uncharacterized protein n=1 Tax=Mortierella polycephala TaxID=41804 RepID=A0A9P6Q629_9FUNG|nr:hypothetical protein BG011_002094 [Mortierella polycephala]
MGTVGVNGKIKLENSERGCLLYMKFDDEYYIDSYNNALMAVSGVMALFSFAICGEIGIGLKGRNLCDLSTSISALHDAQVCAGLMGGCWLAVLILEWFQFKSRFPNSVGHIGKKPRI